ncbi:MAG: L-arabinose transport system permease protein AraP [Elusimicrobia bacterium]|nr:L-arabinose transport system permease protein AraP [Elusimicrobiota bacterium]
MEQRAGNTKKSDSPFTWHMAGNYFFVLPALLMFLIFNFYPYIQVFFLSVFKWNGISLSKTFVGLANYKDIISDNVSWWISMKNAAYVTGLALTVQNGVALMLAWMVDRDIRGGQIYRSIFFLPPILSGIVVGLIWNWIYQGDYGLLNGLLDKFGYGHLKEAWLANPKTALTALSVVHMWKGFGWGFIILLAGLQGIPRELYEAARVDGASEVRIFWKITVPLMIPVFILVSVLTVLGTMQMYDLVITTTRGGPGLHTEVPMKRILDEITPGSRVGYASAMGVVFGAVLLVVSMIQIQLSKWFKAE